MCIFFIPKDILIYKQVSVNAVEKLFPRFLERLKSCTLFDEHLYHIG